MNFEKEYGLTDQEKYRLGVIAFEINNYNEAETRFRDLLKISDLPSHLKERTMARLAATLNERSMGSPEAWKLAKWVRENAEDSEALTIIQNMNREATLRKKYEQKFEDVILTESRNLHFVYRHFDQDPIPLYSSGDETQLRELNKKEHYDIYLDFINSVYCIRGQALFRSSQPMLRFLFTCIRNPRFGFDGLCTAMFDDENVDYKEKRNRNRFDQSMRRIRLKLQKYGIQLQGYSLPTEITYCLFYDENFNNEFNIP